MFFNHGRFIVNANFYVLFTNAESTIYLQIKKDEGLPEKICYRCSEKANISYVFKKLCESSDITLREISKQFELQRELFREEDQEIDIPKEIILEQNIIQSNNGIGKNNSKGY